MHLVKQMKQAVSRRKPEIFGNFVESADNLRLGPNRSMSTRRTDEDMACDLEVLSGEGAYPHAIASHGVTES